MKVTRYRVITCEIHALWVLQWFHTLRAHVHPSQSHTISTAMTLPKWFKTSQTTTQTQTRLDRGRSNFHPRGDVRQVMLLALKPRVLPPRVVLQSSLLVCATLRARSTIDCHHCHSNIFFQFPHFPSTPTHCHTSPKPLILSCSMSIQSPLCPKCLFCMILVLSASFCSTLIDSSHPHSSSLPLASCPCSFILYHAAFPFTIDLFPLMPLSPLCVCLSRPVL